MTRPGQQPQACGARLEAGGSAQRRLPAPDRALEPVPARGARHPVHQFRHGAMQEKAGGRGDDETDGDSGTGSQEDRDLLLGVTHHWSGH